MNYRMDSRDGATRTEVLTAVCRELFALAKQEDDTAAAEALVVPYWSPVPTSVDGHRAAARTLRRAAEDVDAQVRAEFAAQARARATAHNELAQAS